MWGGEVARVRASPHTSRRKTKRRAVAEVSNGPSRADLRSGVQSPIPACTTTSLLITHLACSLTLGPVVGSAAMSAEQRTYVVECSRRAQQRTIAYVYVCRAL